MSATAHDPHQRSSPLMAPVGQRTCPDSEGVSLGQGPQQTLSVAHTPKSGGNPAPASPQRTGGGAGWHRFRPRLNRPRLSADAPRTAGCWHRMPPRRPPGSRRPLASCMQSARAFRNGILLSFRSALSKCALALSALAYEKKLFLPEPNLIEVRFPDDVLKRPDAEKRRFLFCGDQPISVLGRRVTISR